MTAAESALLISSISAAIALFAVGWNVYRDVILKPKVKVRVQISEVRTPGEPVNENETRVDFTVTNHGPGIVVLNGLRSKTKKFLRKTRWGIMFHDYADPLTRHFPCKLEIAEQASFFLPFRKGIFLKDDFTKLGIADSFGHVHWVPKKDIKRTKESYIQHFGEASNSNDSS